ncbi:putative 54S ribosomal protein L17, mitochondrial [Halenospora varia]|nr:putative 54S ribosomal protein L17, mitochondrial [Halenospora varia]
MTASSRGTQAAASLIRSTRVCSDCISKSSTSSLRPYTNTTRRSYAVAAAAIKTTDGNAFDHKVRSAPPVTGTLEPSHYTTKAGILLSRPPLLTRNLDPFEKAFFFYQKRLNERLAIPFTRYFYFKKDTPADADWKLKAKERNWAAARDLGGYQAYGKEGWNDEVLVGDRTAEPGFAIKKLIEDSMVRAVEGKDGQAVEVKPGEVAEGQEEIIKPKERKTKSDKKNRREKLDRKLDRTLYLVVKRKGNGRGWELPCGELVGRENLHQAAERILVQSAGLNMNTWIVGHVPIGHHIQKPHYNPDSSLLRQGSKTFFMKGRIMAGQADLTANQFGLTDFNWLTREEIEEEFHPKLYKSVHNMLAER